MGEGQDIGGGGGVPSRDRPPFAPPTPTAGSERSDPRGRRGLFGGRGRREKGAWPGEKRGGAARLLKGPQHRAAPPRGRDELPGVRVGAAARVGRHEDGDGAGGAAFRGGGVVKGSLGFIWGGVLCDRGGQPKNLGGSRVVAGVPFGLGGSRLIGGGPT